MRLALIFWVICQPVLGECVKDSYRIDALRKDIDALIQEKKWDKTYTVSSTWREIDLKGLPLAYVFYFRKVDAFWSLDIDLGECKTPICAFNKMYQRPRDDIAGFVALYLFLKTGYVIAVDTNLPRTNIKGIDFSDIYFKDNELYSLWEWAKHDIKELFNLSTMQAFYRMPTGYTPKGPENILAYIFINTRTNLGGTVLYDRSFAEFNPVHIITHELFHHFDYVRGRMSNRKDFLNLTGWKTLMHITDNREVRRRWVMEEDDYNDDFLSLLEHPALSPKEDFAESGTFYRFFPEEMRIHAPQKFVYFREKVFKNKVFTKKSQRNRYLQEINELINYRKKDWEESCENALSNTDRSLCFRKNARVEINNLVKKIKMRDYDACSFFASKEGLRLKKEVEEFEY